MNPALTRKEETRQRILESASRLFLQKGVDGVGVDEIMREAGLTHGGFYVHFPNKEALVSEVCLCALDKSVSQWEDVTRRLGEDGFFEQFLAKYLSGDLRSDNPACPMAILGPDVSRRSEPLQTAYAAKLRELIEIVGQEMGSDRRMAIVTLAALVGATSLATQVVQDKALAEEILNTTREELLKCRPAKKRAPAKVKAEVAA